MDEFKNALRDQAVGAFKYGASTSYRHNKAAMEAAKADRLAREQHLNAHQRNQVEQWQMRFRDGRSNDMKVVFKPDQSYTDVYFGGVGAPDGSGHGHIRIWVDGTEQIVREPFRPGQPNAKRDATLLDDNTPDKRL
ncbi:hypothetical protein AB0P21_08985 [Kribbella sp. NPDC056861]|uniref:hypothetical protein n=1 Tax=Kribbella sp. NPDC056861 TaxID=3154857 RepID=UPI003448E9ED